MGCPFPMIARKHKGSGILAYPQEVESLLNKIKNTPELEFSLKIRLGWESAEESFNLIDIINSTPIKYLTVHPRLGKQQYEGKIDIDSFEHLYNNINHPLI